MDSEKRNLLEQKIIKLIKIEDSEEFKKANKIVVMHRKLQDDIKKFYKELNILKLEVNIENKRKILEFKLRERHILDKTMMPDDIIEKYSITDYTWYKNIYDLD